MKRTWRRLFFLKPLQGVEWVKGIGLVNRIDPEGYERLMDFPGRLKLKIEHKLKNRSRGWTYGEGTNLEAWQLSFRDMESWDHPEVIGEPAEDVLFALKRWDAVLGELIECRLERPKAKFDNEWKTGMWEETQHYTPFYKASRTFNLRACAYLGNGEASKALEDILTGFYFGQAIKDEPWLGSLLSELTIYHTLLQPVWEGLKYQAWSKSQLIQLEQVLANLDLLNSMWGSFQGERLLLNYMLENPETARGIWVDDGRVMRSFQRILPELNLVYFKIVYPAINVEEQLINVPLLKYPENTFPNPNKAMQKAIEHNVNSVAIKAATHKQNVINMARIACQLEIRKMDGVEYPERLEELDADLPHDVITGEPFHYSLTKDGRYRLYSIGWNEVDDGGKIGKKANREYGDWVWQYTKVPVIEDSDDE